MRIYIGLGALLAGIGVMLGAFGAHSLKAVLTAKQLDTFHTAVQYQFYHSLALILVGILGSAHEPAKLKLPANLFVVGILLFSGSLYGLTLGGPRFLGPLTPLGGLCFIIGWFNLAWTFLKKNQ